MMMEKLPARRDVPLEQTWDLSLIFEDEKQMWQALAEAEAQVQALVQTFRGQMNTAGQILGCLEALEPILQTLDRVQSYASLALEADYTDNTLRERDEKVSDVLTRLRTDLAFVDSEMLEAPPEVLEDAIRQARGCHRLLTDLALQRPHRLSPETEKALTALGKTLDVPYTVYNTMKLADIAFEPFTVAEKSYPLSYSLFEDNYELEADTPVRRGAFAAFYGTLAKYKNTTAAAYNACVSQEKTMASLRHFDSVFDSLLFSQKVTREMYDRQIDGITARLAPAMRRYARLLGRLHHLEPVTFADLKISVDPACDPQVTIEDAHRIIREALSVLGEDYTAMVDRAFRERWVDFAQNTGKSTGGFCAGVYRQNSFILLNWNGRMADVFTLAHELGHAGQSMYSDSAQSFYDTNPSVYLVEAPSTMNELLLARYLAQNGTDKRFRRWVLASLVSNTYYHNFVTHLREAWYQREVYRIVDAGGSVNADVLSDLFQKNLRLFWGEDVQLPQGAELTWMRQPHYYMGLYPYTYSAGLTVATQAMLRIGQEGETAVQDWKRFLAAGGSLTPVEQARVAGVDITTDAPLNATIDYIASLIDQICTLTEEIDGIRV